jgi:hypothetical protein
MHPTLSRPQIRRLARWLIGLMVLVSLHSALAATLVLVKSAGGSKMVEVCTSYGVRWVRVQTTHLNADTDTQAYAGQQQETPHSAHAAHHCPLCHFVGDSLPDLTRSDLRFAPPRQYRARPPDQPPPNSSCAQVVLKSAPRGPPSPLL